MAEVESCASVQIWKSSPPMEDVPSDLPDVVHGLIRDGWTVDKAKRPNATRLLQHDAFHLLGQCFRIILPSTLVRLKSSCYLCV